MKTAILVFCIAITVNAVAFADESTRTVTTTVEVAALPADVLRAFLDDAELKGWWKVTRSLVEARQGGVWSISWDNYGEAKTHHSWSGVIEELDDDHLVIGKLVMNEPDRPLFAPLTLEITVTPAANGTTLTVNHHGYQRGVDWDWMYATVVAGWQHVLGDLQAWYLRP